MLNLIHKTADYIKKESSFNPEIGQKLKKNFKSSQKCFICKDLFDNLNYFLKMMIDSTSDYSYCTFSVGTTVKPSIVDRISFFTFQLSTSNGSDNAM